MKARLFCVVILWGTALWLAAPISTTGSEDGIDPPAKGPTVEDKGENHKEASGNKQTARALKNTKKTANEDRPWIIKERPSKKPETPPKPPAPVKWKDDAQRLQCETLLKKLQKSLFKARTYSIRGDTCATARHADGFLDLANRCNKKCPEGFIKSNGYSEKIVQNVKVLSELGKKACLDK